MDSGTRCVICWQPSTVDLCSFLKNSWLVWLETALTHKLKKFESLGHRLGAENCGEMPKFWELGKSDFEWLLCKYIQLIYCWYKDMYYYCYGFSLDPNRDTETPSKYIIYFRSWEMRLKWGRVCALALRVAVHRNLDLHSWWDWGSTATE